MKEPGADTRIHFKDASHHGFAQYDDESQKWDAKLDTSIFITDQSQGISHRKIIRVSVPNLLSIKV